ncbi:unnamed protein product [Ophioblennius macclurei]
MRPAILGLLLAFTVTLCSSAIDPAITVPLIWPDTFQDVSRFPKQGNKVLVNPWRYLHRMSMNRLIIHGITPYTLSMGPNPTDGPAWGFPMQLNWLMNSGRLANPTGKTSCEVENGEAACISPKSWWACQNYFISAVPFMSAAEKDFMGPGVKVQMQNPDGFSEYCNNYADCTATYPVLMAKWDAFFQGLKDLKDSPMPDLEKKDTLLGLFWDGQMMAANISAVCNSKQKQYSPEEVSFANDWLDSASYVAGAHFHLNLENAFLFAAPMPSRVLKVGDVAPNIADLTVEENYSLKTFSWIKKINKTLFGMLKTLWTKAMCSVETRERARELMKNLMLNTQFATENFMSVITDMVLHC